MPIAVSCPGCARRYQLDATLAGRKARCKGCGREFRVPDADAGAAAPKAAARAAPADDPDGPPPPRRAMARPTRAARRPDAGLPPLVKAGLILLALLTIVPGAALAAWIALVRGQPALAVPLLAVLGAEICLGLAIVGHLKIVFLAHAESTGAGLAAWFVPFFMLGFVARRWEDTRGPFLAHTAGVAGLILWCVFVPPYLKGGGRPGGPGGSYVALIVAGIPDDDARGVIQDEIKALADRFGVTESRGESSTGQPDRYLLAPVRDPRAFARGITFGTVTSVWGRDIYVTAAPVSPEAVAARRARRAARDGPDGPDGPDAEGREDVAAGPGAPAEPGPPADADAVTRASFALKSPDLRRRKEAVRALNRPAPEGRGAEVVAALRPLLDDPDRFLVDDVIRALGACEAPEAVPVLIEKLPDERHRNEAIKALGALRDPRALGPMLAYLKTSGFQVADALRRMGPAAEPALLERLGDPDRDVRREVCTILKDVGGAPTLAFMQAARPDPDAGVRMMAQMAQRAIAARVGAAADAGAAAPRPLTEGPPARPGRRAPR